MRNVRIELTFSAHEVEEMIIDAARAHLGPTLVNGDEIGGMNGKFELKPYRLYSDVTVVFTATKQEAGDE
jgi:hypothetical protein